MTVFFQQRLSLLILHDGRAIDVEIVDVGAAEPVVDDHGEKDIIGAFFKGKIDRFCHLEVILDEPCGILSYA